MPAVRTGTPFGGPGSPTAGGRAIKRPMKVKPAPKTIRYTTANATIEDATPGRATGETLSAVRSNP